MTEWSKNNLACRRTWGTLRILDQNKKVFKASGKIQPGQTLGGSTIPEQDHWMPLQESHAFDVEVLITAWLGIIAKLFRGLSGSFRREDPLTELLDEAVPVNRLGFRSNLQHLRVTAADAGAAEIEVRVRQHTVIRTSAGNITADQ